MTRSEQKTKFLGYLREIFTDTDPDVLRTFADTLYKCGKELARIYEREISEDMTDVIRRGHESRKALLEDRVTKIFKQLGLPFSFNDDPRGFAIYVKLPNGKINSLAGEWGI